MTSFTDVSIILATYNEEDAVNPVLTELTQVTRGEAEIILVDSSTDNTVERANRFDVVIFRVPKTGIGDALRYGIDRATGDILITMDCDGSYPVAAIPKMVEKIRLGFDLVNVSRLQGLTTPNMPKLNIIGNYIFVTMASLHLGRRIKDVTSGLKAMRASTYHEIGFHENYAFSAELLFKYYENGYEVKEIFYPYRERIGETKLSPMTHGSEIFVFIYQRSPILFSVIALLFGLVLTGMFWLIIT